MQLRALGGLRLEGANFTRPKPLLLLAYLALEGAQNRRHLAELFWPDGSDHMKSLTVALARLRKGAPGAVEADGERVWTGIASDVDQFLNLLQRGEKSEALGLYQGRFLEGFHLRQWSAELEEWLHATREFLAGRAATAALEQAEELASGGRFRDAALLAEDALGQAGSAVQHQDLARLHTLLVAGDSMLANVAARDAVELGATLVPSRQQARERLCRPPGGDPGGLHNLPARGTPFVGRDLELTEIGGLLSRGDLRLLTLVGPPGIGKSRLAYQLAQERRRLGDGEREVVFVPLEAVDHADALPQFLATRLGVAESSDDELTFADLAGRLSQKPLLLVLDGFEHLMEAAQELSGLLGRCPGLQLLVTSRERLNLTLEQIFPLGGLPYPRSGERAPPVMEAPRFDAMRLFVQRARRANPSFELSEEVLPDVLAICRLVEGLPLGIELAACWVRAIPCRQIATEMRTNLDILSTPDKDVPSRHRSLRSAFEHSWALLDESERAVLMELSVFRSGFDRKAAAEVAGAMIPILASLVDKSLLRVDSGGRFDRHPLLYQFVREKLESEPKVRARAEEQHARRYFGLLAQSTEDLVGGRQRDALEAIELDLDNVHAAWEWAAENRRIEELWLGCRPLQLFYIQKGGYSREGARRFAQAADALDESEPAHRPILGRLLVAEAWFRFRLGETDSSVAAAERGLPMLREFLDRRGERDRGDVNGTEEQRRLAGRAIVSGLNTLGHLRRRQGDYAGAWRHYQSALEVARRQAYRAQIAILTNNLAMLHKEQGNYAEAEKLYGEALALNRRRGNFRSVVRNLLNLSSALVLAGKPEQAQSALEEAWPLAADIGYEALMPNIICNLGGVAHTLGDRRRARGLYEEALALAGESSERNFGAQVNCLLGRLAAEDGEYREAQSRLLAALEVAWDSRDRPLTLEIIAVVAQLRLLEARYSEAARLVTAIREQELLPKSVAEQALELEAELKTKPAGRLGVPEEPVSRRGMDETVQDLLSSRASRHVSANS